MESILLNNILAASVIAAVITAIFSYANAKKRNSLDYITEERKAWRSDLRKIAEKINGSDTKEELYSQLIPLKVRINPNAKMETEKIDSSYIDYLIWKQIQIVEDIIDGNKPGSSIKELKRELIILIEALLKCDWELSKSEVRQGSFEMMIQVGLRITVIIFLALSFMGVREIIKISGFSNPFIIFSVLIMLLNIFKMSSFTFEMFKMKKVNRAAEKAVKKASKVNKSARKRANKAIEGRKITPKEFEKIEELLEKAVDIRIKAEKEVKKAEQVIGIAEKKILRGLEEEELLISVITAIVLSIIAVIVEVSVDGLLMNWKYVVLFLVLSVNFTHLRNIISPQAEKLKIQKIKIIRNINNKN